LYDVTAWKPTIQNFIIVKMPYFGLLIISLLIWDCVIRDKILFRVPERYYVVSAI
jgi:hypothetical protein